MNPYGMSERFIDLLITDRGTSQGVSHSVERALRFRVLGEVAGVSRGWCIIVFVVRVRVAAHAKVNTKADGHCNNDDRETRRDKLGMMWNRVRSLYYSMSLANILPRLLETACIGRKVQRMCCRLLARFPTHWTYQGPFPILRPAWGFDRS